MHGWVDRHHHCAPDCNRIKELETMRKVRDEIKACVSELQPLCKTDGQEGALYFLVNIAIMSSTDYNGLSVVELIKKRAEDIKFVGIESEGDRMLMEMLNRRKEGKADNTDNLEQQEV